MRNGVILNKLQALDEVLGELLITACLILNHFAMRY